MANTAFQGNAFQNLGLTPPGAGISVDAFQVGIDVAGHGGGGGISGGTFSRGRWRKIKDDEAAEVAAILRAEEKAKLQAEAAAQKAREDAKTALDEFRRQREIEWGLRRHVASTQAASEAMAGAHHVAEHMRQAALKDWAARSAGEKMQADAEEEAFIERLLLDE